MTLAYVGLGSNLGDRRYYLAEAFRRLGGLGLARRGPVMQSRALLPPEETAPQPDYLNTVVALETALEVRPLFEALKAIERDMGRESTRRWAPRIIDLDLLLYADAQVNEPDLVVPHPRMTERRFVLAPLAALAPEVVHPVTGLTARALLARLG